MENDINEIEKKIDDEEEESVVQEKIRRYFDKRDLVKQFLQMQPIHYDENKIWWLWDKANYCWKKIDETAILNGLNLRAEVNTLSGKEKSELLEAFRQEGRLLNPKNSKNSWVQFKNKIYDIETGEEFDATPEFFIFNPIPWKVGEKEETPKIDALLESWVGSEHKQEVYEIFAFSIVPNYFIHRIFWLLGAGANGKGTLLRVLEKFLGENNTTSCDLNKLMKERFEGAMLYKKLACIIGESNFRILETTGFLKSLSGEDFLRCEFKGKDPFKFQNYAKIIIASNSLPPTLDKTPGFYRRQKAIDFPNTFSKEKDILKDIPGEEFENFALKCLNIAKKLWVNRTFTNDVDFKEREKIYEEKSNPLILFIKENYKKDINCDVLFSEFIEELNDFLNERGKRILTNPAVSKILKNDGFIIKKKTIEGISGIFIEGLTRNSRNERNEPIPNQSIIQEPDIKHEHFGNYKDSELKIKEDPNYYAPPI